MAATTATFGQGRSLEFVATFQHQKFQHVGFVADLGFNDPWAIISTGANGTDVLARTTSNPNGVSLGATLLGSAHHYRIDWTATGFDFFVDGSLVTTIPFVTTGPMLIGASATEIGSPLVVDWMRMSPYAAAGTFESRVFDAGTLNDWTTLTTMTSVPEGTSVGSETRSGTTADTSDTSWSAWAPVTAGAIASPNARYLQYRVTLTASDPATTPAVERVELTSVGVSNTAPVFGQNLPDRSDTENATINLQIVASDVDGDSLTYTASGLPTGVSINTSSGLISGTIAFDAAGSHTVTVTVTDGALSASATFSWTVTTAEDTAIAVTLSATDADNDSMTYTITTPPAHGTLSGSGSNPTYTPAANYHGPDSFTYAASDESLSTNATVNITVTSVDDPPVAQDDSAEVNQHEYVDIPVLGNDSDIDSSGLTPTNIDNISPAGASATVNADGTVRYTAPATYTGPGSFTYQASDGTLSSNTATVNVTVFPAICSNDTVSDQDGSTVGTFTRLDDSFNCKRYTLD
ncbi:MAG: Ig-like domain-containing protein, partial [Ilumatobacteraceae bacterium]